MELGSGVAVTLLASAQGAEVLGGLGDDVVVEVEVNTSRLLCKRRDVSRGGSHRGGR